ncbi:hypothetical protein [Bacillus sp. JJ1562]|uniref:hypothetical protein n=1 Tax=Bacillus sp. JJ1562 TaxID=3122960 RepID=UPI0030013DAF
MGKYRTLGTSLNRDFRNNLNANFNDIDTDIKAQRKRVDDLIVGNPQPSEVIDARLGFPLLSDKLEDVDAQLAQTTQKVELQSIDFKTKLTGAFNQLQYVTPSVETDDFSLGLRDWSTTSDIIVTDGKVNMPTGGVSDFNVALYKGIRNARAIEVTLASGGFPDWNRIAFGSDLNNFAYISPKYGDLWRVMGKEREGVATGSSGVLYDAKASDVLKAVRQGQAIQLFVNNILSSTFVLKPEQNYILPEDRPIMAGVSWRDNTRNVFYDSVKVYPESKPKYMHLSSDDVIEMLKELSVGNYNSVWDHPIFGFLKAMHDKYGAVFSLYCFYTDGSWNLSQMTTKFKDEFRKASSWLRFGFHAYEMASRYDNSISSADALNHYNLFLNAIKNFASPYCIDVMPRIHYYTGTIDSVRLWRDARVGVKGFLSADDTRAVVYYLNSLQRDSLVKCDDLYDPVERLYFVRTDVRLENHSNPISVLDSRKTDSTYAGQQNIQCVFTHEQYLYQESMKTKIENACKWALQNGYTFAFPMDYIQEC